MDFASDYLMFLLKAFTALVVGIIILRVVVGRGQRMRREVSGYIQIRNLNRHYARMKLNLAYALLGKKEYKRLRKQEQAQLKTQEAKPREKHHIVYLLNFEGDIQASGVESLREEISALLTMAKEGDEVVVRLDSHGGMMHAYGLATAQLQRIVDASISLTVCIDKIAASGGYMMAAVAHHIIASPFAVIGSIGVVGQLPNFHRFLQRHEIDFEQYTAGEYKRTLSVFGENTPEGRQKFIEELQEAHEIFKGWIEQKRPHVQISQISTGESWLGVIALQKHLVDALQTSDQYIQECISKGSVYEISYQLEVALWKRIGRSAVQALQGAYAPLGKLLQGKPQQGDLA